MPTTPLVVEVDGRVLHLESDSVLRIGRAIEADIVLTAGSVSRQHAELRPVQGSWVLVDTGSQFGTFVFGRRVAEWPISGRTEVQCGPPAPGSSLTITPADQAPPELRDPSRAPALPPTGPRGTLEDPTTPPSSYRPNQPSPPAAPPGSPGLDQTQVLALPTPPRPGAPAPARTGPDLLLVAEGREHRFRHPAHVTVGRRPDCTVVLEDPAVSRLHGEVSAVPGGWVYTNVSNEGTFHAGRRITTKQFDERLDLRLAHPVAGPELSLVPILSAVEEERRIARKRLGRRLAVIGVVAAVVLLIVGTTLTAVLLTRGGDDPTAGEGSTAATSAGDAGSSPDELTEAELDAAKAATVKITGRSHPLDRPGSSFEYSGSGSIIRSDGLILTNAHVAAPEAPGLVEQYGPDAAIANPDYVLVSLTDGMTDTSAPAAYRARVVQADGYLDVAVIEIYADAAGNELTEEPDLPTAPLGTSAGMRAGSDVTILGFPGVAGSGESITVTTGVISTVLEDAEHGRWEFDTDARIAPGNSGGMAVDDEGRIIGVPTAILFDRDSPVVSGRIRAIDVVKPLIEAAGMQVD